MDYRFNGNAFVLSVLAQALNPTAHPNDLAYCTVVSEDDHIPALPADHRELLEDEPEVNHCRAHKEDSDDMLQHIPDGGVLCLVSKLPFFDFSFALLDILRQNLEQAPALLERINEKGMAQLARGLEVGDLIDKPRVLGLTTMSQRMPEPLLSPGCEWSHFANLSHPESSSPLALTLARWQVWWGLMTLLMRWGDKLLEVVIKLLPCVVLEQQVLLLGDAPRACVVALLLRGMLWPFQWQHPFICAPLPPAALHELPLLEACCPMIMAFGEMPMLAHFWRYDTVYQLPPNIVVGLLRNEWVYINEKLETTGGLSGTNTSKFPPFVQTDLRNKIKEARKRLRNRQNGQEFLDAVQQVQDAVTEAIGKLAGLVKSYAKSRVAEEQHGGAMSENQAEELRERSYQRALKVDEFLAWLRGEAATYGEPEPVEFYKTFLQTQCFMNLLFEALPIRGKAAVKPAKEQLCGWLASSIFLCAAGASGGRSRQGMLKSFGILKDVKFGGTPNLTSAEREAPFLSKLLDAAKAAAKQERPVFLVGHSFGARAALHLMAREDFRKQLPSCVKGVIAFGYPLVHPTQHREKKILELPSTCRVLFISGTRDPFAGDFKLMEQTLKKARCKSKLVKVDGGDHSLKCPKSLEAAAVSGIEAALQQFIG
ncbi:unnamed protein product [Effrenium voratum]|nr:unnamed protein product [Effrenium voratum]